jgi:hypothetical protein
MRPEETARQGAENRVSLWFQGLGFGGEETARQGAHARVNVGFGILQIKKVVGRESICKPLNPHTEAVRALNPTPWTSILNRQSPEPYTLDLYSQARVQVRGVRV